MKALFIIGLGLGLIGETKCLWAQAWDAFANPVVTTQWQLTAQSGFTEAQLANRGFTHATLGGRVRTFRFEAGIHLFLNQQQRFVFAPKRLVVERRTEEGEVTGRTELVAAPDQYMIRQPFSVSGAYQSGPWRLSMQAMMLRQEVVSDEVSLDQEGEDILLNALTIRKNQTRLLGNIVGGYRHRSVQVQVGMVGLPVSRTGDADFDYVYQPKARPYVGLTWGYETRVLQGDTDIESLGLKMEQQIAWGRGPHRVLQAQLSYQMGVRDFAFTALQAQLIMPITRNVKASLMYRNVWNDRDVLDRDGFDAWQNAMPMLGLEPLHNRLAARSVQMGLVMQWQPQPRLSPIRMIESQLYQPQLFHAKRAFYANNPVGSVKLYNTSKQALAVQLIADIENGYGQYRSESVRLDAGEVQQVPFYLFLAPEAVSTLATTLPLHLTLEAEGEQKALTSFPVQLYGKNAWDGNTSELSYFVTPDDPLINRKARQIYLKTFADSASQNPSMPTKQFNQLKDFLNRFGSTLQYIPDPTSTISMDQVQVSG